MAKHATIHGYDTTTPVEGKDGTWRPVQIDATGALVISGTVSSTGVAEDTAHANGDTGNAVLAVRRDAATSGVGADGDYAMLSVTSNGALRVADDSAGATTGTPTSVASATSAGTILAANTARLGATFMNDDANILYLLVASTGTASSTVCTVAIAGNGGYYELPVLAKGKVYTGIITGIWGGDGSGGVRVTEYTA